MDVATTNAAWAARFLFCSLRRFFFCVCVFFLFGGEASHLVID